MSWALPDSLSTYWLAAHKPLAEGRAGQQHWVVWQLEEMGCELVGQGQSGWPRPPSTVTPFPRLVSHP